MPRYFFHVRDGAYFPDTEGTVLAGPDEARSEAITAASTMLKDTGDALWTGEEWTMHVVGEDGVPVCDLVVRAMLTTYENGTSKSGKDIQPRNNREPIERDAKA
jgi:hypothetical protein